MLVVCWLNLRWSVLLWTQRPELLAPQVPPEGWGGARSRTNLHHFGFTRLLESISQLISPDSKVQSTHSKSVSLWNSAWFQPAVRWNHRTAAWVSDLQRDEARCRLQAPKDEDVSFLCSLHLGQLAVVAVRDFRWPPSTQTCASHLQLWKLQFWNWTTGQLDQGRDQYKASSCNGTQVQWLKPQAASSAFFHHFNTLPHFTAQLQWHLARIHQIYKYNIKGKLLCTVKCEYIFKIKLLYCNMLSSRPLSLFNFSMAHTKALWLTWLLL